MSKPKKKFSESTVGKLLFGAASIVNPTLGNVLKGVTSPKEAIAEIGKSKISTDDKIKLQQLIYEQQNKEMESITSRWQADAASDSWLSKNVRPLVLVWCIVVFSFAGILDSIDSGCGNLLSLSPLRIIASFLSYSLELHVDVPFSHLMVISR